MGLIVRDETALLSDKVTPYTMLGYKFMEENAVYLTTVNPSNPYSKKLLRSEINALKAWLASDDYDGVFADIEDGFYVHRAQSAPDRLHVRDKSNQGHIFTYIPADFFQRI